MSGAKYQEKSTARFFPANFYSHFYLEEARFFIVALSRELVIAFILL